MHDREPLENLTRAEPSGDGRQAGRQPAHVIVVGNQKGGVGKSTTALHIIVTLLRQDRQVASVDLDAHQWSLSRYFSNRTASTAKAGIKLPLPEHWRIWPSLADSRQAAEIEERTYFQQLLDDLSRRCEFIVLDCAGGDQYLSRLAHSHADTLVTPLNDSFIDFDLLARFDGQSGVVGGPSVYAEFVWECRKQRASAGGKAIDWVVLRNRLSHTDAHDKRRVGAGLTALSKRIGFRIAPGLSERVIYRELFPHGLTMLDVHEFPGRGGLRMSDLAARQEVRAMITALALPPADGA